MGYDLFPDPNTNNSFAIKTLMVLLVATLASSVRFMLIPRLENPWAYVRSVILGAIGCVLTFVVCIEAAVSVYSSLAASGVVSAVADDLIRGLLLLTRRWKNDPDGVIGKIMGRKK